MPLRPSAIQHSTPLAVVVTLATALRTDPTRVTAAALEPSPRAKPRPGIVPTPTSFAVEPRAIADPRRSARVDTHSPTEGLARIERCISLRFPWAGALRQGAWFARCILLPLLAVAPTPALAQRHMLYGLEYNWPTVSGQHLGVASKTGLQGTPGYTLEAWVNPYTRAEASTIFGNNYQVSYWLGLNSAGRVMFFPRGVTFVEGSAVVPLNQWTHVAATYDATTGWAIYVNGNLDASDTSILGLPGTTTDSLYIGADREAGPAYFWQGKLDDLRIWDRALTATAIRENMATGPGSSNYTGPRYAGLRGLWYSNIQTGGVGLSDLARPYDDIAAPGESNLAVASGDLEAMFQSSAPPYHPVPLHQNAALEFNGIDDYATVSAHADGYAGGVSVEAWIYPYSWAGLPTIAGRNLDLSSWLGLASDGKLRWNPLGGAAQFLDSSVPVALNRWTHVAATYDPVLGKSRIFINGELDSESSAFTGPPGPSGYDIHVGGDAGGTSVLRPFRGMLDEVAITNGPLLPQDIRQRRFFGADYFTHAAQASGTQVTDANGAVRHVHVAHFGPYLYSYLPTAPTFKPRIEVNGSHARLVLSGAPMFDRIYGRAFGLDFPVDEYVFGPPGELGLTAPDQLTLTSATIPVAFPTAGALQALEVFVSLGANNLGFLRGRVRSPSGTLATLFSFDEFRGRSLQAVFKDGGYFTSHDCAPCNTSVTPSTALATLNGESTQGSWQLLFDGNSPFLQMGVWAVGLRITAAPLAVAAPTAPALTLANAGEQPVRQLGSLTFTMPSEGEVQLELFDAAGRRVRTLQSGTRAAGAYHVVWNSAGLAPGLYLVRLRALEQSRSIPVTVLR